VRTHHIRALTGIRFFAALWVVVYHVVRHYSGDLAAAHPRAYDVVAPVAWSGVRGVDLFFMLSGFVLALNYLEPLGSRPRLREVLRFLGLRLARIWPLYLLVAVFVGGGLRLLRADLWGSAGTGTLTWTNFFRQALMVQQWFPPERGPYSWVGPAWSLSAEWLAYLLFPLFAVVAWRLRTRLRPWQLFVLAGVVLLPLVFGITSRHAMIAWVWLPRILCQFACGMLLCAAVTQLRPGARGRRFAGAGAVLVVMVGLAWLYATSAAGVGWLALYSLVLFAPLIALLALGTGPLTTFLASPPLVLGGGLSYALYLVHSPALHLLRDYCTEAVGLDRLHTCYVEIASIPFLVLIAWALFRFFEEPVRRVLRGALSRFSVRRDVAAEGAPVG
jgi:peptidoglycan/LPS O-acetylase OafA/YrhL